MAINGLNLGQDASAGRVPNRARAFTITELRRDGAGAYVPTPVRFVWDSATQTAPRPSWKFGLKQRTKRTDYAGADEPTEQILGPSFKPFTVDGVWDDRYAGEGFAWGTFEAFEQLVARGNPVRIEFEDLGITGIITEFDPEYRRRNYIRYAFTFSPHFRQTGGIARTQKPQVPIALAQPEQMINDLSAIMATSVETQDAIPSRLLTDSNVIIDIADKIGSCLSRVEEAKQTIDNQLFGPIEQTTGALKKLAAQMRSLRGDAQDILGSVAGVVSDTELIYASAVDLLDFEVWKRGIAFQARLIVGQSAKCEDQFNERVDARVKAIYRPHYGENLYAISQQFYNTPHNWRAIQEANGLSYLTLQGNETLVIPELR